MNLDALRKHSLLRLPKDWKSLGYRSYYECVSNLGSQYLKVLEDLDDFEFLGTDKYIGRLSKQSLVALSRATFQAAIHSIRIYLDRGDPHLAYKEFETRFSSLKNVTGEKTPVFALTFKDPFPISYRIRYSLNKLMDPKDIFHVPFEKRYAIASNRFSIPGYPTLYLSNSVYVAYRELDEPQYDDLYVSKFSFHDFSYDRPMLLDLTVDFPDGTLEIFKYLARWPLLMACCIKVGHPSASFKPEYILPQMILLWVRRNVSLRSSTSFRWRIIG